MTFIYRLDRWFDLKQMQKVFLALTAIPLFLIPADFLRIKFQNDRLSPVHSFAPSLVKSSQESLVSYHAVFEKSSFFGNISGQPLIADRISIADLVKDYRLKGVIITKEPEAMLEDARTQKINYLHKGSQLGDLVVKEIKEGFVVLVYGTQEKRLEIQ